MSKNTLHSLKKKRLVAQRIPFFFRTEPKLTLHFVFCLLFSLTLLFVDVRYDINYSVRKLLFIIWDPMHSVARVPARFFGVSRDFFIRQTDLLHRNKQLADELFIVNTKLLQMEHLQRENDRLRAMLNLTKNDTISGVLAQIRYPRHDYFSEKIMIDQGEQTGIKIGQPVVNTVGLVGQIIQTQTSTSKVRLIIDKDFPIPVMVLRNRLRAIIYGGGVPNTMEIRFLVFNSDIKVGDKLVTSGLDGVYPEGIPVATVKTVESSPDSVFAHIVCEPFAKLPEEHYVFVITTFTPAPSSEKQGASRLAAKPFPALFL